MSQIELLQKYQEVVELEQEVDFLRTLAQNWTINDDEVERNWNEDAIWE